MGRLQRMLRWANVLLIFLTLFSYLSPYIHPGGFWPFSILGLLYPVLLALLVLSAGIWLLQRRSYALFSLGCILLGWGHFTSFVGIHLGNGPPADDEETITVMSYNVFQFVNRDKDRKERRWQEDEVLAFLGENQPDIWCIQEFPTSDWKTDPYYEIITGKTPLKYGWREQRRGLALFSRWPIKVVKTTYFKNRNYVNGYLIADLEIDGQTYRMFNIHLQSNAVSRLADEVANNGHLREKKTWMQIKDMIGQYRRTTAVRSDQALEIRKHIEESPHPIILCGDFNDVPLSYAYHTLSKGLNDSFQKRGRGLGTTFRGSLPALRIDYILSSPLLEPVSCRILSNKRSDHYPVMSVFKRTKATDP